MFNIKTGIAQYNYRYRKPKLKSKELQVDFSVKIGSVQLRLLLLRIENYATSH